MARANHSAKTPLQSKKFWAFLLSEVFWKLALCLLLVLGIRESKIDVVVGSIAMAIVVVSGAIEALYLGGQAALDKYTEIAQIAVDGGQNFKMKGVETSRPTENGPDMESPPDDG